MKEKILCLLSSPNKTGNSATLVDWFILGLDKDKYEVEKIYLYDLNLDYLNNNYYQFRDEVKEQDLGAQELFSKIKSVKLIVIATPVWNFSLPAILKNFLDRSSVIAKVWSKEKNRQVPNWHDKKFYLFFTYGAPKISIPVNILAKLQLIFTLKYYGAKQKTIATAYNCRSGSKNVLIGREKLKRKIIRKAKKL